MSVPGNHLSSSQPLSPHTSSPNYWLYHQLPIRMVGVIIMLELKGMRLDLTGMRVISLKVEFIKMKTIIWVVN